MPATRRWAIVGAVAAVSGLGVGSAAAAGSFSQIRLNDAATVGPAVDHQAPAAPVGAAVDGSPESADSPNASPVDSAGSGADSLDHSGWVDPSPESADSPVSSAADSPAAVPPRKAAVDSTGSSAPIRNRAMAPAADSGNSARSAGSAGGAASAASAD